ncbi:CHAT domain-containing protein [Pseudanabaena sp. 'Roaring Creek']|uniref:CHAT domain-containing protein n=1 Tax=Pseudanabaena sp. 'Roaring Creek' TaxID=1681830 RepID=UPI0006D82411|nr:CHAT domain-containing protein [Pseudanabaena sp. 'Roaring Creek']
MKLKTSQIFINSSIGTCLLLSLMTGWNAQPSIATNSSQTSPEVTTDKFISQPSTNNPSNLIQIGQQQYQTGQYAKAIATWQQAMDIYTKQGDRLNQSVTLDNLALAYQQLGNWKEANQAIANSLEVLRSSPKESSLLANTLNIQGNIQLAQGQAKEALTTWQKATEIYEQLGDKDSTIRSKINQSQALRALGLYPQARENSKQIQSDLENLPDTSLKAASLLNLGEALRLSGDFQDAQDELNKSLALAKKLDNAPIIADALLSLGNTAYNLKDVPKAIAYYQQLANLNISVTPKIQAQLNQLQLQIESKQTDSSQQLAKDIQAQIQNLPTSRASVYARVNFTQSLLKLNPTSSDREAAAQILATAAQQAKEINDPRAESYAIGYMGALYEQNQQLAEAQGLTERALVLAQTNNASDIAYRWQWQLGRVLKSKGENKQAIGAYSEAVNTLASIRGDLVSSSSDVQFSFRESVEPVYRQLVALLLTPETGKEVSQENLTEARKVIESLQLAELDNFFKEACLTGKSTQIDEVDRQAAVVYPIILPNSIEVVISLPDKDRTLLHKTTKISQADLENLLSNLRKTLSRTALVSDTKIASKKVYDLLIGEDIEAKLKEKDIKTLAFVLDSSLRNLPMAVLYDGQQYLIEKYNLALTPGLQLLDPRPLKRQKLEVFTGGISKETQFVSEASKKTQNFNALPNVERELQQIASVVSNQPPLLNEEFTSQAIQEQIRKIPYRVVHLATHGQFSSDINDTYVLTWKNRLDVKQLGEMLQTRDQDIRIPIELLVLSACKTAKGDSRAALGLAGIAVRSGARSTIASLWSVEDRATATFMENFYKELAKTGTTKADALRNAQISLLKKPDFKHPFYWSPFVLIGNWL